MNIMQNNTEKFILQWTSRGTRRTTQHGEVSKYQLISQSKLDKSQSQYYNKIMFEVTSTRFQAGMHALQTFAPQRIIDRCRWNPWKRRRL